MAGRKEDHETSRPDTLTPWRGVQRGAEYNGFGKADSMHLSFTYAFFKV